MKHGLFSEELIHRVTGGRNPLDGSSVHHRTDTHTPGVTAPVHLTNVCGLWKLELPVGKPPRHEANVSAPYRKGPVPEMSRIQDLFALGFGRSCSLHVK